ncbi:hypothetical protein A3G67_01740 [Candidatus Roizmanbacteria bacterium RIFCSPLOWO2_12_FULL_40_12]|uniref:Asn/Gln amidotransferase domain-containing protein n=1 Tax=Candidatus Roizmanbacteria bacterium RIFCSPLOWO2_01_FULL_40_42 TaxID=1802066 RepID=A0A1F7J1Y0_9BACT|nr:MAG: hypothetical protein A2779_00190 [Candidatus Roizmanbacteria bacterium RIFCSPHIGHO2_01_FULL_40_98]OGK27699.1 MAG: hypothetical protein A3C31_04250 [Candidatus Roizmanbacteria bacterium RIFCSPHIGHO2_02_FULL_40_53]OGK29916.1 MAG: hypothetical protein A2W49_04500 [Candidatus Roizmanbacteria bacterium RIFCSPHIGHO2_12_41_18]OGK36534.1 MAG: hypothetical protein A3E69_04580 [Candidatus Roizmanbacteria bacterium RIFCSPHIGHO2_12_FULL_40_130]OGK49611.1 MAG: hypothetical protein A3B50_04120 [Candi
MLGKKLQEEQILALKSGDTKKLSVLRYVIAQIKNKEIEKKEELNDEEVISTLQKIKKELQESIDAAKKGDRTELIADNEAQLKIISTYLPAELSDEQIEKEIDQMIAQNQDAIGANPKALIGIVMKSLRGKADPARIMPILQKKQNPPEKS